MKNINTEVKTNEEKYTEAMQFSDLNKEVLKYSGIDVANDEVEGQESNRESLAYGFGW